MTTGSAGTHPPGPPRDRASGAARLLFATGGQLASALSRPLDG